MHLLPLKQEHLQSIIKICDLSNELLATERKSIYWLFLKFFKNTCFVAVENNNVVGFLLGFLSQTEPIGYIHMLGVLPQFQKQGIATALIDKFGKTIKKHGAKKIYLTTLPEKKKAIEFYKNRHFTCKKFLKLGQKRYEFLKTA